MSSNTISNESSRFGSALAAGPGRSRHGSANSVTYLRATIVRVNPDKGKCDVAGNNSYYSDIPLPNMRMSAGGAGSTVEIPKRGTPVLLRITAGEATISQIIAVPTDSSVETRPRFPVIENATDTTFYPSDDGPSFGRLPKGLLPGDWCKMGEEGQCFALLDGGAVTMRATPMAKVEASRIHDTLNLKGRNLNMFTGFGNMIFTDSGGKSSFVFEGGTDQMTQTGGPLEKWQVRARIGGEAEGLADFQILGSHGERLFSVVLDGDGSIRQGRTGNTNSNYGGNLVEEIGTGYEKLVRSGNHDLTIMDGSRNDFIVGNDELKLFGSKATMIAGSRNDNIRNRWTLSVGQTATFNISGDPIPTPLSRAMSFIVSNGSVVFDIGNPIAGDVPSAFSSFRVLTKSQGGQIELRSGITGFTWIDSDKPIGSVMIGGNILNPAIEPAVLGVQLLQLLLNQAMLYDTHTHISASPGSPTGPTLLPQSPALVSTGATIMSKKVLIGK